MRTLRTTGLALALLVAGSSFASAQVICAPLLMITAAITWQNEGRQLTEKEAFWCGLIKDQDAAKKADKKKMKKAARRTKKQS